MPWRRDCLVGVKGYDWLMQPIRTTFLRRCHPRQAELFADFVLVDMLVLMDLLFPLVLEGNSDGS
jgi:hypothetical protein